MNKAALVMLLGLVGCRTEEPAPAWVPPRSTQRVVVPAAVPSGLIEGKLDAFGLRLPHRSRLATTTPDLVVVDIPYNPADVEEFLRARLEGAEREVGPRGPILANAKVPGVEGSRLDVSIERTSSTSRVTLLRRNVASTEGAEVGQASRRVQNM